MRQLQSVDELSFASSAGIMMSSAAAVMRADFMRKVKIVCTKLTEARAKRQTEANKVFHKLSFISSSANVFRFLHEKNKLRSTFAHLITSLVKHITQKKKMAFGFHRVS